MTVPVDYYGVLIVGCGDLSAGVIHATNKKMGKKGFYETLSPAEAYLIDMKTGEYECLIYDRLTNTV